MTTKIKTIKLSSGHSPKALGSEALRTEEAFKRAQRYRVEQVTDSVEYSPGDLLERKQVEDLCACKEWKVTVVPIK